MGIETGFDDPTGIAKEGLGFITSLDLGGAAKKRERAAKADRDAAIALRDKALAELETAKVGAASVPALMSQSAPSSGGIMATLRAPSFIPGVPWWGVAAGAAVAVWALWPKG